MPRDKEKYIEYDLWYCPRCKFMEFRQHYNVVGRCHAFNRLLVDTSKYSLCDSLNYLCTNFILGKFKKKAKRVSKSVKPTTRIRKVLSK